MAQKWKTILEHERPDLYKIAEEIDANNPLPKKEHKQTKDKIR